MKNNLYILRIKALFSDKMTCITLLFSILVYMVLINNLSLHADKRSSIPIGVVNNDHSTSADELLDHINSIPAFYVYEDRESGLNELLLKEEIKAYFVINEGYEGLIKKGKTDGLIDMYYLEGDSSAKLLSDIVAGEMLYRICLYKGLRLYDSLNTVEGEKSRGPKDSWDKLSEKEYMDYTNSLMTNPYFDFAFDIRMIQMNGSVREETVPNSILYMEAVWGITAMLISFIVMIMTAGIVVEKELGINKRIKIALKTPFYLDFSHFLVLFTILSTLSFILCISIGRQIIGITFMGILRIFLSAELYLAVMILWFMLLAKFAVSTGKYQFLGIVSILVPGFFGFAPLLAGFMENNILKISKFIPNCWFIKELTDIILNTNSKNIWFNLDYKFIIAACVLFVIHVIINKKQYR